MNTGRLTTLDANGNVVLHYDILVEDAVEVHDFFSDRPDSPLKTEVLEVANETIGWAEAHGG